MSLIAQTLADGLVLGGIYALAAVGFSLIFGVLHVINLSHGILVLVGAYLALIFSTSLIGIWSSCSPKCSISGTFGLWSRDFAIVPP